MRRAGAVLIIGGSPFLILAVSLGTAYWASRASLNARADDLERGLRAASLQESRRAPWDWAPYGDIVARLRSDVDHTLKDNPLPCHSNEDIRGIVAWNASGCSLQGWVARVDVSFKNRHWSFIFGIPQDIPVSKRLLSHAMAQDFFHGGGYASAFHRTALERELHQLWHGDLPIHRWNAAELQECIATLDRLEAARPSLRDEIETEHLLRCRDILEVLRSGKDPEHLLKHQTPGVRSIYSRTIMVAQLLRRMDESRDDLLALAARPWDDIWGLLDPAWHEGLPTPPVYFYLDQLLLSYEGQAALRRTLLRTALAVAQYGQDAGHFPDRLEDLVPHYLPALPRCPLTGVVLSYRDGAVSSPEVDDLLRTWLVRRPDPPPAR